MKETSVSETAAADVAQDSQEPRSGFPVTKSIVAINCAVFVAVAIAEYVWHDPRSVRWVNIGPLTISGEWWRLLTSTLVHFSLGHLLGNMVGLWILGKRAEQVFGRRIFLLLYLSCGLAGGIASLAFDPELISCGASAGILGLSGSLIAVYGAKPLRLPRQAQWKLLLLILWAGYTLYPDAEVDYVAHAGGLVAGLVLGAVLKSDFAKSPHRRRWVFSGMAAALTLAVFFVRYHDSYAIPLRRAINAWRNGRTEDALHDLRAALDRRPNSVWANTLASQAYLKQDDYMNAEAAARRVLAKFPDDDHAIYFLGLAMLQTGRCEEARRLALQRIPDAQHYLETTLLWFDCEDVAAGDRYLLEGKPDPAIAAYNKALQQKPDDYRAEVGLSKAYKAKGMQKDADTAAAQAAALWRKAQHSSAWNAWPKE